MEHGCWGMGTVTWVKGWLPSCSADTLSAAPPSRPAGEAQYNTLCSHPCPVWFRAAFVFFFHLFTSFPPFVAVGKKERKKKQTRLWESRSSLASKEKKSPRVRNQQQQKAVPGLFVRPDSPPPQALYAPSSIFFPPDTQKQSFLSQTRENHREETRRPFPDPAAADKTENNDGAIRQNGDLTGTNDYGSILHIVSQRLCRRIITASHRIASHRFASSVHPIFVPSIGQAPLGQKEHL